MKIKRIVLDVQKLESQRIGREWDQEKWAAFLGVPYHSYMKCLQTRRMNLNRISGVAEVLGMDPVELLTTEIVEV